jgi:F0F1-type ATP synthase delta subunit
MATEVNQALAAHAQELFDRAAGRGQRAIDQVAGELDQFARLLLTEVRLRKALADPGLPPEPKRALLADLGQGCLGIKPARQAVGQLGSDAIERTAVVGQIQ